MRHVTIDFAGVGGDVVQVIDEYRGVLVVGPFAVLRAGVHGGAVFIDTVVVIDAGHDLSVVAIVAARLVVDAVKDLNAVLDPADVVEKLFELVVGSHRCLSTVSWTLVDADEVISLLAFVSRRTLIRWHDTIRTYSIVDVG